VAQWFGGAVATAELWRCATVVVDAAP